MFNKYPYTDFHEMNDDWLISKVKEYIAKYDDIDQRIIDNIGDKLEEWKDDGTLADIINQEVFNDLNAAIQAESTARLAADSDLAAYLGLIGHGFDTCTVFTVGQGDGYDYNDLVTAVNAANALTDEPVIIAVYRGTWNTNTSNNMYGLTLENNKILYGMGSRETVNIVGIFASSETTKSTLCLKNNCAIFNCFINGNGGKYTIHDDFHNEGDSEPQFRYIKNCEIYGQNMASGNVIGAGIKTNQHVKYEDVLFYSFDNLPVRYHNWTNCDQDSFIEFKRCTFKSAWGFYGLRLSVLNNYAGYTNYKPVWVNVEDCEIGGGIVIQAEANNPTVNCFYLSCDDPTIPIECLVGNLIIDSYCSPFKMIHATVDASLIDKCVCCSGAPNTYTGFGGGNDLAVIGVAIDASKIAVAGTLKRGSFLFRTLNPSTHDIITITQSGTFELNGSGRAIGFCDAQGFIHFDFRV